MRDTDEWPCPWQQNQSQRSDEDHAALRKQIELEVLSKVKEKLQKHGGGEQVTSCVDAVVAECTEAPKPKGLGQLHAQRKKLVSLHQKAQSRVAELEEQRAKLDKQIAEAKDSIVELKSQLEAADAEFESRQAANVLGEGPRECLKGLTKLLEQFKATPGLGDAVSQAIHQGIARPHGSGVFTDATSEYDGIDTTQRDNHATQVPADFLHKDIQSQLRLIITCGCC